jgi:superfamily I DNA/RNA helicase/RecB family exonuclease
MTTAPYSLLRTAPPSARRLVPDSHQQAVLDHRSGPLLVLAGPGTGKTTTLVEAVARRVEGGLAPDEVLVLTFSRKAAGELRDRITARVGTTTAGPSAWTFHAFCYALVREHQPAGLYTDPLRLLSGPEQDVALRELLRGSVELGRSWPPELRAALGTRGLAEEVRALLSRARELGLDPDDLASLAAREGRPDWVAMGAFFGEYLDVLDAQGAVDYAELVHRAVLLAEQPEIAEQLRRRYGAVFVDEYQDTDPAQERLLQAIAGQGRDLVVVGDPDQAIYAFRGAEVSGLLEFSARFRQADGQEAPVLALRTCRRSGAHLLEVSRSIASLIPLPPSLRDLRVLDTAKGQSGQVEVHTHLSVGAEAEAIADLLRREHLETGTAWSDMAVLVRSGARSVPLLRRVLSAAGVPLDVAGDEVPLAQEPAAAPLLLALRVAADPDALTNETARQLLLSPLGGADPGSLRRLGRALRAHDRLAREREGLSAVPAPSAELVREAVEDPRHLLLLDEPVARPAKRLADLLAAARTALPDGPEAALWALWSGSRWPHRLERDSLDGGSAGRSADRDLDAVVALFSMVSRSQEHRRGKVTALLDEIEAQQIPGDTLAETGVRGQAVRLLTAHRSKGLEWEVVVVAGVQEGVWPDLRRRSSLLESERLDRDRLREPQNRADLLADERRLFYVAATRARRRLVITAVDSPDDDGDRPSRLLAETGIPRCQHVERLSRPLSLTALVATLRRQSIDPTLSDAVRQAAAGRLARLAHATDDVGRPLAPQADPARWWGLVETTHSEFPIAAVDRPIPLSGSSIQRLEECSLRWFLEKQGAAESASSTAMGFGNVVHALAHEIGQGTTDPVVEQLMSRLDTVWHQLAFDAPWQSQQQREQARLALERLVRWHAGERGRTLLGTEQAFRLELSVAGRDVVLTGSMDRLEADADGRVHVVDLKTSKSHPSKDEIVAHAQLGTYQLAIRNGAFGDQPVGGAELVQLRTDSNDAKVQSQQGIDAEPGWVDDLLARAVTRIVEEVFPPDVDPKRCSRCVFARCCPAQPEGRQVIE